MLRSTKGISCLQRGILDALAQHDKPVPPSAIFEHLTDLPPTASQRTSLSRALERLRQRGVVDAYRPEMARPGQGMLYALRR